MVGEPIEEGQHLEETARPSMTEKQWRPPAAAMDEMDPYSVDECREVRVAVDTPLLLAPVEPVGPFLRERSRR